jgi:hypothetical protein
LPKLPPLVGGAVKQPDAVPEEAPLTYHAAMPPVPEVKPLDANPPISVPSPDVNKPPVLVQVKQPAPDAVSVTDPTQDASQQAALEGTPSPRTEAAPFLRLTLPDPFLNRKVSDLYETLPEDGAPVTATPAVPGP